MNKSYFLDARKCNLSDPKVSANVCFLSNLSIISYQWIISDLTILLKCNNAKHYRAIEQNKKAGIDRLSNKAGPMWPAMLRQESN
jgi:hypothetical protein